MPSTTQTVDSKSLELPLLSEIFGRIPYGRVILAVYDPDSQFNSLMNNVAAGHLKSGGDLLYLVSSRPVPEIRQQIGNLGVKVEDYEAKDDAVLSDAYSAQMGVKSTEKYRAVGTNLNEVSIAVSEAAPLWPEGTLVIGESFSNMAFKQEDIYAKFARKTMASWRARGTVMIATFAADLHPPEFYQEMKLLSDGAFEVKLREYRGEVVNIMRARSMKGQGSDTRWREILFDNKMKASLRLLES
jgi:KaiC/GvpD/RAD55 family RecA-like ATPase